MTTLKRQIPSVSPRSGLSSEYLLAFGGVEHYLKRMKQFRELRGTPEALPARWMHLAERTLQHRKILRYREYFHPDEFEAPEGGAGSATARALSELDRLVDQLNEILSREDVLRRMRDEDCGDLKELADVYRELKSWVVRGSGTQVQTSTVASPKTTDQSLADAVE